jgi:transcriptional regulator with XRE-family HTH domain
MSQEDIARILDTARGFIGQVESPNYAAKYNLNHLQKLAKEFSCSMKDFFPEE